MAGTAANLSHYDEVLKTYYLPGIQDYLNHDTILADMIEVNEEDISGKNATIESHYGRSTGTGAVADGGALPLASYQKFKTCTVPMKYLYGRIEVTGPTIAATRDEKGAYAKALDTEIRGVVDDLKKEVNRMLWGAGYGILARWRDGATTTVTLQKKYTGNSAGGDAWGSTFGAKYLVDRGDCVAVVPATLSSSSAATYTVDPTALTVSVVVKAADYDTITVTDADVSEAAATFYIRGNATTQSLGAATTVGGQRKEMMGLSGLVGAGALSLDNLVISDGTNTGLLTANVDWLQGLSTSTYPWFVPIIDSHPAGRWTAQRALTLDLMQTMFDMVEEKAGKDYGPDIILTTRAIRREYLELCQADRRTVNKMELDGGWSALDYNGVPLMVDSDAIDGEIYFLTLKDIQLYRMSDYNWMNKDGAILSRISGYDTYEAVLYRYAELGIKNRRAQGVLTDIAYTKSTNEGY